MRRLALVLGALLLAGCGTSNEQLTRMALAYAQQQREQGKLDARMEAYCAAAKGADAVRRCSEYAAALQEDERHREEVADYVESNQAINKEQALTVLITGAKIAAKLGKLAVGVP